jgi:hypothetical protein
MATETYNIPHSGNANVVTRIVLTDVSPGVLNYSISLVRLTDGVQSFNNFGAPSGPNIVNVSIFGVSIPQKFYTFDWAYSTTRTVTRQNGSSFLRNISDTSLYRVGMTRQSGAGIPAGASIISVGDSLIRINTNATSNGTATSNFARTQPAAIVPIKSGTLFTPTNFQGEATKILLFLAFELLSQLFPSL